MSTKEFWWEFDARVKVQEKIRDRQKSVGGDWEAARKIHSEKMKKHGKPKQAR